MKITTATAEVYVIDFIADGSGDRTVQQRVKTEMEINTEMFWKVESQLNSRMAKFREIKDSTPELTYNQIRAVIALLIRGFEL